MEKQIYTPPEGPPQNSAPAFYDKIGMDRLYQMAWLQYQLFPKSAIAHLFPADEADLKAAANKQAEFMAGVMGGPKIYIEKHGPPRMRARHVPFAIDEQARQEWLRCYRQAFAACQGLDLAPADQQTLLSWIEDFSAWMVNRSPSEMQLPSL